MPMSVWLGFCLEKSFLLKLVNCLLTAKKLFNQSCLHNLMSESDYATQWKFLKSCSGTRAIPERFWGGNSPWRGVILYQVYIHLPTSKQTNITMQLTVGVAYRLGRVHVSCLAAPRRSDWVPVDASPCPAPPCWWRCCRPGQTGRTLHGTLHTVAQWSLFIYLFIYSVKGGT